MTTIDKITDANGRVKYEIRDAKMIWMNFAGKEGQFNPEGRRNFNLVLDEESAKAFEKDGFLVKYHEPRDPDDVGDYTLKVNVNFKGYKPPEIWIKNNHGNAQLNEDSVQILDWANIQELYVVVNPHVYKDSKTAYLDKLLATIQESEYESKFFDTPDSAANTMTFKKIDKIENL